MRNKLFKCVASVMAVCAVAFVVETCFIDEDASALSTDRAVIEEILNMPIGDVDVKDVSDIVKVVEAAMNMAVTGKEDTACSEYIRNQYTKIFGSNAKPCAECAGEIVKYKTYIYGNGNYATEFIVNVCGVNFELTGSKNADGVVQLSSLRDIYEVQKEMYDAMIGDVGIEVAPDADVDRMEDAEITGGADEWLTGADKEYFEETGYASQKSDENNE